MSVNVPDHVAGSGKWEEWWVVLAGVHEDIARSTGGADVESVRRVVGVVDDAMYLIEQACE